MKGESYPDNFTEFRLFLFQHISGAVMVQPDVPTTGTIYRLAALFGNCRGHMAISCAKFVTLLRKLKTDPLAQEISYITVLMRLDNRGWITAVTRLQNNAQFGR